MADIDDGIGGVATDEVSSSLSIERRGCKRPLEDLPPKMGDVECKIPGNDDCKSAAIMTKQEDENETKGNGNTVSPDANLDNHSSDKEGCAEETVDIDDARSVNGNFMDLPNGMTLEWNSLKTRAVLTVSEALSDPAASASDRELRVCLVGRAKVFVVEGSAEVLGHLLEASPNDHHSDNDEYDSMSETCDGGDGVLVTSPFWSSWMTIEANALTLPCKIVLGSVRGAESFKVTNPKRPILLPISWRTCVDGIVQDICGGNSSKRSQRTAPMVDSLEEYDKLGPVHPKHHHSSEIRTVCMITGAKGVGKSTLLRYLSNRILSHCSSIEDEECSNEEEANIREIEEVAILDTDVGQPELAPPGLLRLSIVRKPLLQPPYWNLVGETIVNDQNNNMVDSVDQNQEQAQYHGPQQLHRSPNECDSESQTDEECGVEEISSVFFGASTSKVDPTRYINAVQFLMKKYESEVVASSPSPIPLLINMDGWVKGIGYQILMALIDSLRPTHLVQILGETPGQTFDLPATIVNTSTEDSGEETGATVLHDPDASDILSAEAVLAPKVYQIPACQSLEGASLCRIAASTMRNFRWATYFLPNEIQTFDAWDFVSAKSLQTGWIATSNSDETTTVPNWWNDGTFSPDDENNDNRENENFDRTASHTGEDEKHYSELGDECRLAKALARERPYIVPMEAVEAFVIGSDFEDYLRIPTGENDSSVIEKIQNRIFRALNGCIVALCTNTVTMESLGYGILRSIDWEKRLLYVLVPPSIAASSLPRVQALVGGNLPLPLAMLYRGAYAEAFPYLTTLSKSNNPKILGSEPMKSRNSIGRRGLAKAERNTN